MLDRLDRILLTSHDASATARRWQQLLDAQIVRENKVPALNSKRVVIHLGDSEIEIHEPQGDGPIADHLHNSSGPFAAGFATPDIETLTSHLESLGITPLAIGEDQFFLDSVTLGIPGLRVVISTLRELESVGLVDTLYECTHLTGDAPRDTAEIARVFNLDPDQFVAIGSDTYGYKGTLTLFDNTRLHRLETIDPYDREKTMGRYFDRFGPSLYMCYAEAPDLVPIQARLKDLAPSDWTGSDEDLDGLFIHPRATGSIMMGISRATHAWTWSGFPERVVPVKS